MAAHRSITLIDGIWRRQIEYSPYYADFFTRTKLNAVEVDPHVRYEWDNWLSLMDWMDTIETLFNSTVKLDWNKFIKQKPLRLISVEAVEHIGPLLGSNDETWKLYTYPDPETMPLEERVQYYTYAGNYLRSNKIRERYVVGTEENIYAGFNLGNDPALFASDNNQLRRALRVEWITILAGIYHYALLRALSEQEKPSSEQEFVSWSYVDWEAVAEHASHNWYRIIPDVAATEELEKRWHLSGTHAMLAGVYDSDIMPHALAIQSIPSNPKNRGPLPNLATVFKYEYTKGDLHNARMTVTTSCVSELYNRVLVAFKSQDESTHARVESFGLRELVRGSDELPLFPRGKNITNSYGLIISIHKHTVRLILELPIAEQVEYIASHLGGIALRSFVNVLLKENEAMDFCAAAVEYLETYTGPEGFVQLPNP